MAELLVRIVDKAAEVMGPVIAKDVLISGAGDVIVVQRDGWPWGRKELQSDYWRIWRIPGNPEKYEEMLEVQEMLHRGVRFSRKAFYFDLSGKWARVLIERGAVVELTPAETKRLLALKKQRGSIGVAG